MITTFLRRRLAGLSLIGLLALAACGDNVQNTPIAPAATPAATTAALPATDTPGAAPATPPPAATETTAPAPTDTAPAAPTDTAVVLPTVTPLAPAPAPTDTAAPAPTDTAAPAPPTPAPPTPVPPAPSATSGPQGQPGWQQAAQGRVVTLVQSPDGTLYAGGDGVSRSTDGGKTWATLTTNFKADNIAVAPSNPHVVYAGTGEGCFSGFTGTLYRSGNSGATWTEVKGGPFQLDINPDSPDHLVGLNCESLVKSVDGGKTWTNLPGTVVPNYTPHLLARGVNNRSYIYAVFASEGGSIAILRTTDDGRTWRQLKTPDFYGPNALVVDPTDAKHIYLVAGSGFYATANAGDTWNRLSKGLEATTADTGGYLYLSGMALDRVSPPPASAKFTLYLGSYGTDKVKPAGVFRWNGNSAWDLVAPAPNGQSIRTLLATTAPNQPALIAATERGLYRWPLNVGGQ